jgi:hypothetical protein
VNFTFLVVGCAAFLATVACGKSGPKSGGAVGAVIGTTSGAPASSTSITEPLLVRLEAASIRGKTADIRMTKAVENADAEATRLKGAAATVHRWVDRDFSMGYPDGVWHQLLQADEAASASNAQVKVARDKQSATEHYVAVLDKLLAIGRNSATSIEDLTRAVAQGDDAADRADEVAGSRDSTLRMEDDSMEAGVHQKRVPCPSGGSVLATHGRGCLCSKGTEFFEVVLVPGCINAMARSGGKSCWTGCPADEAKATEKARAAAKKAQEESSPWLGPSWPRTKAACFERCESSDVRESYQSAGRECGLHCAILPE